MSPSNDRNMRQRMLHDEELSEQLFEDYSQRIALEAHEDRLKLWEDVERLRGERDFHQRTSVRLGEVNVQRAQQLKALLDSWSTTGPAVETSDQRVANLLKALDAKQAKIDALMLEFCPGETPRERPSISLTEFARRCEIIGRAAAQLDAGFPDRARKTLGEGLPEETTERCATAGCPKLALPGAALCFEHNEAINALERSEKAPANLLHADEDVFMTCPGCQLRIDVRRRHICPGPSQNGKAD